VLAFSKKPGRSGAHPTPDARLASYPALKGQLYLYIFDSYRAKTIRIILEGKAICHLHRTT
jgi:hypothetical protein